MKTHAIALLVICAFPFAGCIGTPEESLDEVSEVAENEAALSENVSRDDEAEISARASNDRVFAKLNDKGIFEQVSADDAARLSSEEDVVRDDNQEAPDAMAGTACDTDAVAGTMNYQVGEDCDWCTSPVWFCPFKRKYYGTVVQRSDGLYCEGTAWQMHCC